MQIVLNPETKISGIKNINTREQRRVSFCGVDEFIKTAPSGNFAEMKKAIQMKYRPAISQLRAERKEIADAARTAIMSEIIQSKSAETILFNIIITVEKNTNLFYINIFYKQQNKFIF